MRRARGPACASGSRSRQVPGPGPARRAQLGLRRPQRRGERLEPAPGPRQRRGPGAGVLSRRDDLTCRGRQPGLPARQEHGRGTAAAFRDGGHSGLPGGTGFGNDRPGRLAHFAGGIGRRRAGAVPGEQPQSRQPQHAPGVTLSRAMRCRHGGRARPARAKTAVRLPRIPATGRELLRAPRNAERDGARRGPDRLPGRHPPGQRSHLATDRITGSAGDLDVPPDVDSLAHKLSRNHGDGERQAGGVRAGHTAPSVNGIPRIRRKGPGAGNCARHHPVPAGAPAPRSPRPAQSAGHSR